MLFETVRRFSLTCGGVSLFSILDRGIQHEVWFEDVRSLREKFALITEYGLRGCGYWQIMRLFRANWLLLADTFWIQKR